MRRALVILAVGLAIALPAYATGRIDIGFFPVLVVMVAGAAIVDLRSRRHRR